MHIFGETPLIKPQMLFCGLIKGISPKICIPCVRVKINKRCLNLFVFGSSFRTLAVILFQIKKFINIFRERQTERERETDAPNVRERVYV